MAASPSLGMWRRIAARVSGSRPRDWKATAREGWRGPVTGWRPPAPGVKAKARSPIVASATPSSRTWRAVRVSAAVSKSVAPSQGSRSFLTGGLDRPKAIKFGCFTKGA